MTLQDLTIELGSDPSGGCPCCDPDACLPQGYVTKAGQPYALYFSDWDHGASGFVELLISVGDFTEGSTPAARRAAAFHGRLIGSKVEWSAFDARLSLWRDIALVGDLLDAENAASDLRYMELAEVIGLADRGVHKALADVSARSTTTLRTRHASGSFAAAGPAEQN